MSLFSLDKKVPDADTAIRPEDAFSSKCKYVEDLLQTRRAIPLDLFVSVSALLTPEHYLQLGPILWEDLGAATHPGTIAPVSSFVSCFNPYLTPSC